jgi:fumarate reductase subunit D
MTPNQQQQIQQVGGGGDQVRDQDKIMLVLSYLGILCLIPLLTVKDSDYVKWHAKQGLVLGIGIFVVSFILMFIPIVGQIASCLLFVGWLVAAIMGIMKALSGVRWRIPVIADLADKF